MELMHKSKRERQIKTAYKEIETGRNQQNSAVREET